MRDRFITWGSSPEGQRRLYSFELEPEDARITRRAIPADGSSEDFLQTFLTAWKQRNPVTWPAGTEVDQTGLLASGTMVPAGVELEDKLLVASAERDWPFEVVSVRLRKQFADELAELGDVIAGLEAFDEVIFERLKGAWAKVQSELANKVLRYEHSHGLKKASDDLFRRMKDLRRGKDREVRAESRGIRRELQEKFEGAEGRLATKQDPRKLFNDLKALQQEVNQAKLAGPDRRSLRKRLDKLFRAAKAEIDASGADASHLNQQRGRLESRLKGLEGAIKRMRHSFDRSEKDVFYEGKRLERAGNQLAAQLGAAKLEMLRETVSGKRAKLDDMLATEAELRRKLDKLAKREATAIAKREAREAERAAARPAASSDGKPTAKRRRSVVHPRVLVDAAAAIALFEDGDEPKGPPLRRAPARQEVPRDGASDGRTDSSAKRAKSRGPRVPRQLIRDVAAGVDLVDPADFRDEGDAGPAPVERVGAAATEVPAGEAAE